MLSLFDSIFYAREVNELFSDESLIQAMLDVEAALASAQAKHQVIPAEDAKLIRTKCRVELFDTDQIKRDAAAGGNINIPLVKQLTELVHAENNKSATYVHYGATSQDIIDTVSMIQLKKATAIITDDLDLLIEQLASLAKEHRHTVMVGRTLLQHAGPISFGLKVAGWLDPVIRSRKLFETFSDGIFVLQLGGAVGTMSFYPAHATEIPETMAAELSLTSPAKPWHAQRDRLATLASAMAVLSGNIGKMAKDMSLMMQTEIGELSEPDFPGRGGSSAMPHKKNPVGVVSILANNTRIPGLLSTVIASMPQEHERSAGLWHAEWETIAEIVQLTAGILKKALDVCGGLQVHQEQMLKNLELTRGLIYAENLVKFLLPLLGRMQAHQLVESCCDESRKQGKHFKMVCSAHPEILRLVKSGDLDRCFDPNVSLGNVDLFIDRVLDQIQ